MGTPAAAAVDLTRVAKDFPTRQRQYQRMCGRPHQGWQNCYPNIHAALQLLSRHYRKRGIVLELGCHNGGLAVECLNTLPTHWWWHGYDLAVPPARVQQHHPHYTFHKLANQLWRSDTVPFNVFVSSHTLEHLYADEVRSLIRWLDGKCQHIILCVPLQPDKGRLRSWHILEKGSRWLTRQLQKAHFTPVWTCGAWFGWFKAASSS